MWQPLRTVEGLPLNGGEGRFRLLETASSGLAYLIHYPAGVASPPHAHDHDSIVYVLSGRLRGAVDGVEAELAHVGQPAVDTGQIAELVLAQLAALDEVTYLRYASSVRRFREAEEFVAEIERLRELQRRHAEARVQLRLQFDEDQPHWN